MDSFLEKLEKVQKDRAESNLQKAREEAKSTTPAGAVQNLKGATSLLSRLKLKKSDPTKVAKANEGTEAGKDATVTLDVSQLSVDMYRTSFAVVVYASVPGMESKDLDVEIEKEGDVITIRGKNQRPEHWLRGLTQGDEEKKFLLQECRWGSFFRQITLPDEVNVFEVDAKLYKGVLILWLPLRKISGKRNIKRKVEVADDDEKTPPQIAR
ncbi:MAG: hypothetical protein A3A28_05440 [Candidatus Sungbacteria bacterium RIFCSPLOWO2_01_FULL_47_32]|nr:MAG: hypothetical protein A3A28_05440 [Candidatus Sungbacteria bacterium RIFCSPLOWO2_01_FULL_47_32]